MNNKVFVYSRCILIAVFALIFSGCSRDSVEALPPDPVINPPSAPTQLIATAGQTEVSLAWGTVEDATTYTVYFSDTAGVTTASMSQQASTTSATVSTLTNNVPYFFSVTATGPGGESSLATEVSATPFLSAPSMAYLVGTAGISMSSISAEWLVSSDDETAQANLSYAVHLSDTDNFQPSTATLKNSATAVTSFIVDELTANTTYYVMIVTTDEAGNESWSNILPASTLSIDPVRTAATVHVQDSSNAATVNGSQIIYQDASNTPSVGEIIVSGEGEGYLRKVVSVSRNGDTLTIDTEAAHLNEVFSELEIATTIKTVPLAGSLISFSKSLSSNVITRDWPQTGLRFEQVNSSSQIQRISNFGAKVKSGSKVSRLQAPEIAPDKVLRAENYKTTYTGAIAMQPGETAVIEVVTEITSDQSFLIAADEPLRVCEMGVLFYDDQNNVRRTSSSFFNALSMIRTFVPESGRISIILTATNDHVSTDGKPHHFRFEIVPGQISDDCGTTFASHTFDIPVYVTKGEDLPRREEKAVTFSGGFSVESNLTLDFNPSIEVAARLESGSLAEAKVIASLEPNFTQELTITATGAAMLDASHTFIAPRKFYRLFFAGPVPILVVGAYSMDATLTGEASAILTLSETIELSMPNTFFGVQYNPQTTLWEPVKGFETSYKFEVSGTGEAGVELTLTLAPQLVLSFYDVLSGSLILNPYVYANATINGEMTYNFTDGQDSLLADYWFSDMEAGAGIDLKLWAGFSLWDTSIASWPSGVAIDDFDNYNLTALIPKTPIAKIPEIEAAFNLTAKHPEKSRAFRIDGTYMDIPNPFGGDALLPFEQWMHPQLVTLIPEEEVSLSLVDPEGRDISKGEEGALWLEYTGPGDYQVRIHGHSSLGWFIRQVAVVEVTLTDDDNAGMGDGMVDQWETQHAVSDPDADPEWDTLTNLQEFNNGSDPNTFKDDDNDSIPDLWELQHDVTDPNADPDMDDYSNLQEWQNRTEPQVFDEPFTPMDAFVEVSWDDSGGTTPGLVINDISGRYLTGILVTSNSSFPRAFVLKANQDGTFFSDDDGDGENDLLRLIPGLYSDGSGNTVGNSVNSSGIVGVWADGPGTPNGGGPFTWVDGEMTNVYIPLREALWGSPPVTGDDTPRRIYEINDNGQMLASTGYWTSGSLKHSWCALFALPSVTHLVNAPVYNGGTGYGSIDRPACIAILSNNSGQIVAYHPLGFDINVDYKDTTYPTTVPSNFYNWQAHLIGTGDVMGLDGNPVLYYGGSSSEHTIRALNDLGQMFGSSTDTDGISYAVIWQPGGAITKITTAQHASGNMNNRGEAVGAGTEGYYLYLPNGNYGLPAGLHYFNDIGIVNTLAPKHITDDGLIVTSGGAAFQGKSDRIFKPSGLTFSTP